MENNSNNKDAPFTVPPMTPGQKTKENLWHFWCKACKKWWSVGDAPRDKTEWYCPWCGQKDTYEPTS